MTDQAEALPQATSDEPTVSEVASKVDQILDFLKGGGQSDAGSETEPAPARDPGAEVRAELAKLKAAEDRKAARDKEKAEQEKRLAAIEDKVKEKPPREYPKGIKGWFQRANGWGPDE